MDGRTKITKSVIHSLMLVQKLLHGTRCEYLQVLSADQLDNGANLGGRVAVWVV